MSTRFIAFTLTDAFCSLICINTLYFSGQFEVDFTSNRFWFRVDDTIWFTEKSRQYSQRKVDINPISFAEKTQHRTDISFMSKFSDPSNVDLVSRSPAETCSLNNGLGQGVRILDHNHFRHENQFRAEKIDQQEWAAWSLLPRPGLRLFVAFGKQPRNLIFSGRNQIAENSFVMYSVFQFFPYFLIFTISECPQKWNFLMIFMTNFIFCMRERKELKSNLIFCPRPRGSYYGNRIR